MLRRFILLFCLVALCGIAWADAAEMGAETVRLAQGTVDVEMFLSFLDGAKGAAESAGLPSSSASVISSVAAKGNWLWALVLILLGGFAMNLTPCVLPMIPVNLAVIGKSAMQGVWYGLGITVAYGMLGVLAAVGGVAFGEVQGNPWFNVGVAAVFLLLSLSLVDVFFIDFSRFRRRMRGGAFLMGAFSAVLAGACVAPVLIAVLLLTAELFAGGNRLALALPFVMGLGMALPWPFVGAGLSVLPKPGAWMKVVNRVFAVVVLGFAVWYAHLAWVGFAANKSGTVGRRADGSIAARPAEFAALLKDLPRPILVDCWATWCKNCAAMERTTLSDARVRQALERFTVVRLQSEDMAELRRLPGFDAILGLPAFVIFE